VPVKLANAPVSWGVDYANAPTNPSWLKVMNEIRDAGYQFTELGPYGYYPTDPAVLKAEFEKRRLTVVAGFVFQNLHDPSKRHEVLTVATQTIQLLAAVGGRYLVTIDHISDERMQTAGRSDLCVRLDAHRRAYLVSIIDQLADIALAAGVLPVIHQHAGSYIEFEDEFEALLSDLDPSRVGICIDTGHLAYAGIDPVAFYKRHSRRVQYFHFKDVDPQVHAKVLANKVPFLKAVEQKVFCPIGQGTVDWPRLAEALRTTGYDGVATVEQDIDPAVSLEPLQDARASLAFLRSLGI